MEQNAYNLFSVINEFISLGITIVGIIAVYIQIKKIREEIWSNTHSKLTDQSFELIRFLSENPGTYDYFYKNKKLEDTATDKVIILYAAEAISNFLEHLILQKENLPQKQWEVWKRFIYSTLKSSEVIVDFIFQNKDWYSSELFEITEECKIFSQKDTSINFN